jgi:hypothetical protein
VVRDRNHLHTTRCENICLHGRWLLPQHKCTCWPLNKPPTTAATATWFDSSNGASTCTGQSRASRVTQYAAAGGERGRGCTSSRRYTGDGRSNAAAKRNARPSSARWPLPASWRACTRGINAGTAMSQRGVGKWGKGRTRRAARGRPRRAARSGSLR